MHNKLLINSYYAKKIIILIFITTATLQVSYAESDNCLKYDYSRILMNNNILGYIGNGQRLYIHFDTIYKDKVKTELYHVIGKSRVKNNIACFTGNIHISKFKQLDAEYYPINRYKIIAKYEFKEDSTQYGTGVFSGRLESDFFIYKDSVYMDEIYSGVDGYYNNQYEGVWKSYKTNAIKKANFGIGRIPNDNGLDIGSSEFRVDPSKQHLGWDSYMNVMTPNNKNYQRATAEEQREWWKINKEKLVTWQISTKKENNFANIYINHKYLQSVQLTKAQIYTIEQDDYNFDGQRDICFYPQQESKPIIYLWSTKQGKYIKAKSDSINSYPIIVPNLKFLVTQQSDDNQNCYTWEMYQYTNNKFVLYSKLIRDYTKGIYLLEETFAPNGTTLRTKHYPTYEQLNKKWQKYCFYDYLDDLYNEKAGYSK